jgi:hypothetical protein
MNHSPHIACLLLAISCNNPIQPSPKTAPSSVSASLPASIAASDSRSMADFGKDWAEIAVIQDEVEKRLRATALISKWEGHEYEWDSYILFNLCNEEKKSCAANVIERKKVPKPELLGGFFPVLFFTDEGFTKLRQDCKGKTACVVRFQGILSSLRTDPEFPLGMTFTSVGTISGRDPSPDELWFRQGASFELPKDYKPTSVPLANPNEPPLPPLTVKVLEKTF